MVGRRLHPLFFLFVPLFLALALPALGNHLWCEEAAWLMRVGRFRHDWTEVLSFYGRDFNPLFLLSLDLSSRILGPTPFGVHLTDILIHLVSSFLLAVLFSRLSNSPVLGALGAAAWMISRHTDEAVLWMGARPIALSFLLFLAAFLLIEAEERRSRITGHILFVLSLLTKETGVLLLPIVFSKAILLDGRGVKGALSRTRHLIALTSAYLVFRVIAYAAGHSETYGGGATLLFLLRKFSFYITNFLEVSWWIRYDSTASLGVAIIFLAAAAGLGGRLGRFGAAWIVITALPFLPIPKHAVRYSIYPYPGFILAATGLYITSARRWPLSARIVGIFLLVLNLSLQSFIFRLDLLDMHDRAEVIRGLEIEYLSIADEIPDEPFAFIEASGRDLQPRINSMMRVAKLNAHIDGGVDGIILFEDLAGSAELPRGRAIIPSGGEPEFLVIHDRDGFRVTRGRLPSSGRSSDSEVSWPPGWVVRRIVGLD